MTTNDKMVIGMGRLIRSLDGRGTVPPMREVLGALVLLAAAFGTFSL